MSIALDGSLTASTAVWSSSISRRSLCPNCRSAGLRIPATAANYRNWVSASSPTASSSTSSRPGHPPLRRPQRDNHVLAMPLNIEARTARPTLKFIKTRKGSVRPAEERHHSRVHKRMAAVTAAILLSGCATMHDVEGPHGVNDPFEPFNLVLFDTTRAVDKGVFRPIAIVYRNIVPEFMRGSVRNFLNNLDSPITLANDVLQGEINRASDTL